MHYRRLFLIIIKIFIAIISMFFFDIPNIIILF